MPDDTILTDQIAYYRARAAEYDEWFDRKGRFDYGPELNQRWFDEAAAVRAALHDLPHVDHALELASGTGIWTAELVKLADRVTALDASPEMIAINRGRVNSDRVNYLQADLFAWEPDRTYDMVFFGFWLSHVPPDKLHPFLTKVRRALNPGGKAFMVDSRRDQTSTAPDQPLPQGEHIRHQRTLNDGRTFTIIKIYYEPEPLRAAFEAAGFAAEVRVTPRYFIYAAATAR